MITPGEISQWLQRGDAGQVAREAGGNTKVESNKKALYDYLKGKRKKLPIYLMRPLIKKVVSNKASIAPLIKSLQLAGTKS